MSNIVPKYYYDDYSHIDIYKLKQIGKKVVICDIDNTLVRWDEPLPSEKASKFIDKIYEAGLDVVFVSNNREERVRIFANCFSANYIANAVKPFNKSYKKILKLFPELDKSSFIAIGDQIFTDVLGANRMGICSILVKPICNKEHSWTRFMRIIEKFVLNKCLAKTEKNRI